MGENLVAASYSGSPSLKSGPGKWLSFNLDRSILGIQESVQNLQSGQIEGKFFKAKNIPH
jgi:hypothetical protein